MAPGPALEKAFEGLVQFEINQSDLFLLSVKELKEETPPKRVILLLGQDTGSYVRPCTLIKSIEPKEISPNSGIYEASLEISFESQSDDTPSNLHIDRVGYLHSFLANMEDTVERINAQQSYIHLSGYVIEGPSQIRDDRVSIDTFRFNNLIFMIYAS